MNVSREKNIYQLLLDKRRISYKEIADICHISVPTVRKIVLKLQNQGLAKPIYGGAELSQQDSEFDSENKEKYKNYNIIVKKAITLISDNDVIFLGPGKTVSTICKYLGGFKNLTVFTNSIPVITTLSKMPNIHLISTGGILQQENMAFSSLSIENLPLIYISKFFIGGAGINPEFGVFHRVSTTRKDEDVLAERSQELILLVDKSKFSSEKAFVLMPINKIHTVITNKEVSEQYINILKEKAVNVILA